MKHKHMCDFPECSFGRRASSDRIVLFLLCMCCILGLDGGKRLVIPHRTIIIAARLTCFGVRASRRPFVVGRCLHDQLQGRLHSQIRV